MKTSISLFAALLLSAHSAFAQPAPRKDLQLFNDVAKSVNRYDRFTIFDDVSAEVKDGVVTLSGKLYEMRGGFGS